MRRSVSDPSTKAGKKERQEKSDEVIINRWRFEGVERGDADEEEEGRLRIWDREVREGECEREPVVVTGRME